MRFARGAVGDPYRLVQNRSQTSAVVRTSDAAAEGSKDQLSRARPDIPAELRIFGIRGRGKADVPFSGRRAR